MRTALTLALLSSAILVGAEDHPRQITVNGKNYAWPKQPVVVMLIDGSAAAALKLLTRQPGVELVLDRAAAAKTFDLPADRIGDLIVVSDRGTVLGKSKATLDLSALGGMRLRSHGGLADRNVYLIFSRLLSDKYAAIVLSRQLRNFDVFEFVLNGLR
jgi:phosphonoacetate hydrolase